VAYRLLDSQRVGGHRFTRERRKGRSDAAHADAGVGRLAASALADHLARRRFRRARLASTYPELTRLETPMSERLRRSLHAPQWLRRRIARLTPRVIRNTLELFPDPYV